MSSSPPSSLPGSLPGAPPDAEAETGIGDSPDLRVISLAGREITLVGVAHVSRESAELARRVIRERMPEGVCIELDEGRYQALRSPERFEEMDLREVIQNRQARVLVLNLLLAAYQRAIGRALGVRPGAEMLAAAESAEQLGIPLQLCDRDVGITLSRAAASIGFLQKNLLAARLLGDMLNPPKLDEASLRELRRGDTLNSVIESFGESFPALKRVLIDERDAYMAQRIRETPGRSLVVVVGAGHLPGLSRRLETGRAIDTAPLLETPPPSRALYWLGWGIPLLILGALAGIGVSQGLPAVRHGFSYWALANGIPAALGAVLALAHPLTVLVAFLAAPFTSLTPLIGVGYLTGLLQAWLMPPRVRELRSVLTDLGRPGGPWQNRMLRVLLVLMLTTLGSLFGTVLGGWEILGSALRG